MPLMMMVADLWIYVFLTVFKSYQDDGWVLMKGSSPQAELQSGTARSAGQRLIYKATGASTDGIKRCDNCRGN